MEKTIEIKVKEGKYAEWVMNNLISILIQLGVDYDMKIKK